MAIGAVHQFHPACASGDGITSGLFLTQKILRRLGYASEIFCEIIPPELTSVVRHLSKREDRPDDVLLFHHSLGYRNIQWLKNVSALKVLVYHNITPDFLLPEGELRELSRLGRDQLPELRSLFAASVGDSEENAAELAALGYRDVRVLPLLVDLERYAMLKPNPAVLTSLQDFVNILFVGRIADNKRQSDLVDCFNLYHRNFESRARLQLVGGCTSAGYLAQIQRKIHDLELGEFVSIPGKVSHEDLTAHFQVADVYLSLSEHEGFGMPLIEAMALGVPVVAHASTSIPWTVGPGGLLLETRDPEYVAATLDQVVGNAALRRAMRRGARRSLARFAPPTLEHGLAELLHSLGGKAPRAIEVSSAATREAWRVEGVDRELVLALSATGVSCVEGESDEEAVTLRSCEPPRTEGMRGLIRVHAFGREEPRVPQREVDSFNQRLDLVTVVSTRVKRVLMDAGVKVPIGVVGAGTDPASWASVARRTRAAVNALSSLPQFNPDLKVGWLTAWNSPGPIAEYARVLLDELPGTILANRTGELVREDSARVVRCWDAAAESLAEVFEQFVARGLDAVVIQYHPLLFKLTPLGELITRLRERGIAVYCICHSTTEFTRDGALGLSSATRLFVHSDPDLARLEECGLANASRLLEGKALASRLRDVIESCDVDRRFARTMPQDQ